MGQQTPKAQGGAQKLKLEPYGFAETMQWATEMMRSFALSYLPIIGVGLKTVRQSKVVACMTAHTASFWLTSNSYPGLRPRSISKVQT